jgi:hypothetical protein
MDRDGFRTFLKQRKLTEEQIAGAIEIVGRFEKFLNRDGRAGALETATAQDVSAFSAILVKKERNTWDNYLALIRCGAFVKNDALYVAALDLIDGAEALKNLHRKLGETVGPAKRDEIFAGIELPPMGMPNDERPWLMQTVVDRMEAELDPETCTKILGSGLRNLENAWYLDAKRKYEEAGSVDAYLVRRRADFIAELEKIRDEGKLFFNQPITDDVIDYVRQHREIQVGVRQGNVVYEAKIPHQAIEYLAETDPQMKAHYYCHCPWAKASLRPGSSVKVPPVFCNCSAAFHKKSWEVIFGQPLQAEVVETVLAGDPWCRFAIHLPEGTV